MHASLISMSHTKLIDLLWFPHGSMTVSKEDGINLLKKRCRIEKAVNMEMINDIECERPKTHYVRWWRIQ